MPILGPACGNTLLTPFQPWIKDLQPPWIYMKCRRPGFNLWFRKILWRRERQPTPVFLPGKSHGQRYLVGCSPWGVAKSRTRQSDFTFTFHFHALEKEMATHSSALVWRIPGTAEPGGLPSIGSHRVGHNWSDLAAAAACQNIWCSKIGFPSFLVVM